MADHGAKAGILVQDAECNEVQRRKPALQTRRLYNDDEDQLKYQSGATAALTALEPGAAGLPLQSCVEKNQLPGQSGVLHAQDIY